MTQINITKLLNTFIILRKVRYYVTETHNYIGTHITLHWECKWILVVDFRAENGVMASERTQSNALSNAAPQSAPCYSEPKVCSISSVSGPQSSGNFHRINQDLYSYT